MDELKRAHDAISRQDYDGAVSLLRGPADAGRVDAQYLLGSLYFTSADVDPQASRQCLERAAAQGHANAMYLLSIWHADGATGPPETEHGRALLLAAAECGSLQAQRDVGCYYAIGDGGFPLDLHRGRQWYSRAAEGGHPDAQYNYGLMIMLGEGGLADPDCGLEWVRRAASQNDKAALDYLSRLE